jgi:hypothetical protein
MSTPFVSHRDAGRVRSERYSRRSAYPGLAMIPGR